MNDRDRELLAAAREVMARSYSPYSRFRVGAALLDVDGVIHTGTNVENASFGLSICAERSAIFKAVADGAREFSCLAIVTDTDEPTPPCGACRQVIYEFAPDLPLLLAGRGGAFKRITIKELMPLPFASFTVDTGESDS